MGLTKFPNGISSMGVPVVGGAVLTTGSVFFVDSTTGSNGNSGTDSGSPFATIDYAINQCTANKGDVILVMPNHAETGTTAATFDADVAGISIIGLGNGDDRPTITLGTSTGCDVDLAADNVLIRNLKFDMTAVDAIAAGIDVDGAYITIEDCEIMMGDSDGQATVAVAVGASSHGFTFRNNHVYNDDAGATEAIQIAGVCNDIKIQGNWIDGDFSAAAIGTWDATNSGTQACLRMLIDDNKIMQNATGKPCIHFGASSIGATGLITDNYMGLTGTAIATLVGYVGQANMFNNYINIFSTTQGELLPAADGHAS